MQSLLNIPPNLSRLIFLMLFVVTLQSCGAKVNKQDEEFLITANVADLSEITASKFAVAISKEPRVVALAQIMIAHHTQIDKELGFVAKKSSVSIPDSLTWLQQKKASDIARYYYGTRYDRQYVKTMVDDHIKAITLFTNATHSTDTTLRAFANKTLPTLKMHLDSAKAVYSSLK